MKTKRCGKSGLKRLIRAGIESTHTPASLPAASHEGCNEKINQCAHFYWHSVAHSDCVNIKSTKRELSTEGMKQMLFFVSQKTSCALELIRISPRFIRSAFSAKSKARGL